MAEKRKKIYADKLIRDLKALQDMLMAAGDPFLAGVLNRAIGCVENQPEASPEDDGWISVEERLPEEHDSLFAKHYGTPGWRSGMFRKRSDCVFTVRKSSDCVFTVREYKDGTRITTFERTIEGQWDGSEMRESKVTHWMPLPEPPKEV